MWYSHTEGFAFASEKKALEAVGYLDVRELNPRSILEYDIQSNRISFHERQFFSITPIIKKSQEEIVGEVSKLFISAIEKRIPEKQFGILFSGGVDSTMIEAMCKKLSHNPVCYTTAVIEKGMGEPADLISAKAVAKELGLTLKVVKVSRKDIEKLLPVVVPLIEDTNVVKVEVAVTFYAACEQAKKDGCKVIFSGLGSEEIFAGYQRHKQSQDINKECLSGLIKLYERDTYRDDVITMHHNLELRLPFLDKKLVAYSLRIPEHLKIKDGVEIFILREVALGEGIPVELAMRKKKAAQYGSNVDKVFKKIAAGKKTTRSEMLREFYPSHNLTLGV